MEFGLVSQCRHQCVDVRLADFAGLHRKDVFVRERDLQRCGYVRSGDDPVGERCVGCHEDDVESYRGGAVREFQGGHLLLAFGDRFEEFAEREIGSPDVAVDIGPDVGERLCGGS